MKPSEPFVVKVLFQDSWYIWDSFSSRREAELCRRDLKDRGYLSFVEPGE